MSRATFLLTLVFLLLAGVVLAADGYDLSWHVISGGGGHSAAGAYALEGAVVQPVGAMSGGDYELQSGFWCGVSAALGMNHAPTNGTITPNSGGKPAGQIVYFTSTYFDQDGHGDLRACRLHIGRIAAPKSLGGNAVLLYQAPTNKLMIRNNSGTRWWGGKLVGSANVIQNSQAKVHCNLTTVTRSGNKIKVRWAVEFKPAFRGRTKMYLKARDKGGLTSALQKKGTWTVQ